MKKSIKNVTMEEISPLIQEVLSKGEDVTITASGNSMMPLWVHGKTRVVLTKCEPEGLKKGDVPLYIREDGKYVLHRIIRVNADSYDLAGDAQVRVEKGLPKASVLAVTKGYYSRKGKFIPLDKFTHRVFSSLWILVRPLRRYILAVYRRTIFRIIY